MSRKNSSILIQLRTEHAPLNKHLFRIKKAESPLCHRCGQYEESVQHFIMDCPAYANARRHMNQKGGPQTRDFYKLLSESKLLPHLYQFLSDTNRLRCVFGKITPPVLKEK
ncbi:hypothetical protein BD779DRAFT_1461335 [Infundibulicybe gibba]|nr:hypothetical protein BD779DRAFT_1461335 [Infundibulicybe gibba]